MEPHCSLRAHDLRTCKVIRNDLPVLSVACPNHLPAIASALSALIAAADGIGVGAEVGGGVVVAELDGGVFGYKWIVSVTNPVISAAPSVPMATQASLLNPPRGSGGGGGSEFLFFAMIAELASGWAGRTHEGSDQTLPS